MQLYELRARTLTLLENLRKGSIGPENYVRNNGKTTALLIYAKELLDTGKTGGHVWFACHDPNLYRDMYRKLFPTSISGPGFIKAAPRGLRSGSYLLVDEPFLLNWDTDEWAAVGRRAKIVVVGRAF